MLKIKLKIVEKELNKIRNSSKPLFAIFIDLYRFFLKALNRSDARDTDIEAIKDTLVDCLFSFLITLGLYISTLLLFVLINYIMKLGNVCQTFMKLYQFKVKKSDKANLYYLYLLLGRFLVISKQKLKSETCMLEWFGELLCCLFSGPRARASTISQHEKEIHS